MRKSQQPAPPPARPPSGGSEYFRLVAAAERCVRMALNRDPMTPARRKPIPWPQRVPEGDPE